MSNSSMGLALYTHDANLTQDLLILTTDNTTLQSNANSQDEPVYYSWGLLSLTVVIIATVLGNILVCLAVCWERRLQNMTNYFLMSLAIADLMVSLLVMPLGMIVEVYGYFPFHPNLCVVWATMDVLMCTASIWHMCTMSMDRYFTLKYPMKYGRNKTKKMVVLKILFVWIVSIAICSPLCIMGFSDYSNVFNHGICAPAIKNFVIYGSIFAFYIPLFIMLLTYVLTLNILCTNKKLMNNIARQDQLLRIHRGGCSAAVPQTNYFYRSQEDPAEKTPPISDFTPNQEENIPITIVSSLPNTAEPNSTVNSDKTDSALATSIRTSSFQTSSLKMSSHNNIPGLPGISPAVSQRSLQLPRETSNLSYNSNLSLNYDSKSFYSLTSLNSALSRMHSGSTNFDGSFEKMDIIEKLSIIEQEMDECLQENQNKEPSQQNKKEHENTAPETREQECACLANISDPPSPMAVRYESVTSGHSDYEDNEEDEEDMPSENSGLITVNIKPNGMYMYYLDCYEKTHEQDSQTKEDSNSGNQCKSSSQESVQQTSQLLDAKDSISKDNTPTPGTEINSYLCSPESLDYSLDNDDQNSISLTSSMSRRSIPCSRALYSKNGSAAMYWYAKSKAKNSSQWKKRIELHKKGIIPKRTANNERKASKVLGIIFLVFAVLWTPFFVVNVLSVTCEVCFNKISPATMASIVWLGYLSSLANPIIYTMFNTAFRRAFIKILTCKCSRGHPFSSFPDSHYVNSNWANDRRATLTLTLRDY